MNPALESAADALAPFVGDDATVGTMTGARAAQAVLPDDRLVQPIVTAKEWRAARKVWESIRKVQGNAG